MGGYPLVNEMERFDPASNPAFCGKSRTSTRNSMILLIDNYDSFTYNLFQLIESLGGAVKVFPHDGITLEEIRSLRPEGIVISPGPKTPSSTGICIPVIRTFHASVPILGICLGHQCIGTAFGAHVQAAKRLIHGRTTKIFHSNSKLLAGLPDPFYAARYHSLALNFVPSEFVKTAWDRLGDIMAMEHSEHPLFGIQFHPESFMTDHGAHIMRNFLHV